MILNVCYITLFPKTADTVDPWIRLDLGIEYYVQYVHIETAGDESALSIMGKSVFYIYKVENRHSSGVWFVEGRV